VEKFTEVEWENIKRFLRRTMKGNQYKIGEGKIRSYNYTVKISPFQELYISSRPYTPKNDYILGADKLEIGNAEYLIIPVQYTTGIDSMNQPKREQWYSHEEKVAALTTINGNGYTRLLEDSEVFVAYQFLPYLTLWYREDREARTMQKYWLDQISKNQ
jgi:hypothetical protein